MDDNIALIAKIVGPKPGWVVAQISSLLAPLDDGRILHHGWSPQCENVSADVATDWGVLKTTAIQQADFLPQYNKKLPDKFSPKPLLEVKVEDLLLTCAGPRARCGIACLVRNTPPRLMISGKMYRFRVASAYILPRYIEAYLQTQSAQRAIDQMKTGISDSGLNLTHKRFLQLPIPIAPFNEQQRIVAKLDAFVRPTSRARAELDRIPELVAQYKEALLQRAFDGDLTARWRKKRKLNAPRPVRLANLVETPIRNGLSVRGSDSPPGVRSLRLSALRGGYVDLGDVRYLPITPEVTNRFLLREGDILISRGNGTKKYVGIAAHVGPLEMPTIFPDTAFRIRPILGSVDPFWLNYLWNAPQVRRQIEKAARTTAGIWKVAQSDLAAIELILVDPEEQREIVRIVSEALIEMDRLATEGSAARRLLDRLDRAILNKAFRGELGVQDPNDEPANSLLDRMKLELRSAKS